MCQFPQELQRGETKNYAGLASLTNVSTTSVGTGAGLRTVYNTGNNKLTFNGALFSNPLQESLITGETAAVRTFEVVAGADVQIGKAITINGYTAYTKGLALYISRVVTPGNGFREATHSGLYVNSGGNFKLFGATINTRTPTGFISGANITIRDGVLDMSRTEVADNLQFRCFASCDIDGFTVIGGLTTWGKYGCTYTTKKLQSDPNV